MNTQRIRPDTLTSVPGLTSNDALVASPCEEHITLHKEQPYQQTTPRMRFMQEAYAELREQDPGTSVSFFALRQAVLVGDIPSVKVGRRRLLDMANVYDYFGGGRCGNV